MKMSAEMLGRVLSSLGKIESWCKDVREFAQSEAAAGRVPPGWKLVEGRALRVWKDQEAVVAYLRENGYDDGKIFKRTILGIGDAEKLIGKSNPAFATLTNKPEGKPVLVPESDPRNTIERATATEDFK